jgi:hypothetical protein
VITLDRAILARWNRAIAKQPNGCWWFLSTNTSDGYPRWRYKPGALEMYAFVWAYQAFNGDIPDGMQVAHLCHDRAVEEGTCDGGIDCPHRKCANPAHLGLQTPSENTMVQRHANRRKTHCPQGHPLAGDNLIVWKDGKRRCRTCLGR